MLRRLAAFFAVLCGVLSRAADALDNGVANTPPRGVCVRARARVHVFTQALIVRVQLCVCRLVLVAALPLPHRLQ